MPPLKKIRVLVVDDAIVVRRIVTDTLATDSEIEVVGTAANGKIAQSKFDNLKPDAITMDIEMPEMDGLQALQEIRKRDKKVPIIMFSTLTQRGGKATLDALSFGASDYVTKPANVGSVSKAMDQVKNELIPRIKALCGRSVPKVTTGISNKLGGGGLGAKTPSLKTSPINKGKVDILTIGVSTGGPNALADLLPLIPGNLPVPVVLVQHMPPFFTKLLADRLNEKCKLAVKEGESGQKLEPGTIWIAPGNFHMVLKKNGANSITINTNQGALENSCRPAVDVLFRSVCEIYKARTLGVILTGMGQDGLIGCEQIKKVGGQVVVQDEETSVVWGMPGFVAKSGIAEKVLPLKEIAHEITERVKVGRYAWMPN